jgi:hypothetical protein
MLSKKSQTALRLISRRKANHATIDRRYALRPVAEVTGEFIVLSRFPHTIVGSPHLRLGKFVFSDAKRLFRQHRSKAAINDERSDFRFDPASRPGACECVLRLRANRAATNSYSITLSARSRSDRDLKVWRHALAQVRATEVDLAAHDTQAARHTPGVSVDSGGMRTQQHCSA